eukprot:snap_masked-scaffold_34-processed-gene-0.28-mRNA-1 protein AED:1.00 eAED:1.00 QI:0/-1/0/0/-1/1/1/0/127
MIVVLSQKKTIISESKLSEQGFAINKSQKGPVITQNERVIAKLEQNQGHFISHETPKYTPRQAVEIIVSETAAVENETEFKYNLNHYRFAHLNNEIIKKNNLRTSKHSFCIGWNAGKLVKKRKGNAF